MNAAWPTPAISAASCGREAFDVAQDHGGAPVGGQLVQRPLERPLELAVERLRLGPSSGDSGSDDDRVLAVRVGLGARGRAPAQPPLRLVERDPVQPGREPRPLLESLQPPPGPHEHLLGHLVGLARVEPEAPQRAVHAVGVHHDQLRERVLIAGARPADQLMLGGQARGYTARRRRAPLA